MGKITEDGGKRRQDSEGGAANPEWREKRKGTYPQLTAESVKKLKKTWRWLGGLP